jgi:outer membrane lipoprotein SlyB
MRHIAAHVIIVIGGQYAAFSGIVGRLCYWYRILVTRDWIMFMRPSSVTAAAIGLLLVTGLTACAPTNTNTTYTAGGIGVAAQVRYGTIIAMRGVQIAGSQSGVGAATGAVAGGVLGSTIGGDWRARTAAGVGGALLGGLAGNAIEGGVTQGQAVEFTIRPDGGGPDFTVVQTNELGFQPGERVAVSFGDRVRLARGAPPAPPMSTGVTSKKY